MEILSNSDVCVALVGQTNRSLVIPLIPARAMDFDVWSKVVPLLLRTYWIAVGNGLTKHNTTQQKPLETDD